jgi:hypothetical protein
MGEIDAVSNGIQLRAGGRAQPPPQPPADCGSSRSPLERKIIVQFKLNLHDAIFEVTTSGDAILQGYFDFTLAVLDHEEWKPGGLILLNHTELNTGPLTIDDIQAIANISEQYSERLGKVKVAIVVDRDLDYGMTRMWQSLVESHTTSHDSSEIFRNRDEAVAWLKSF